MLGDPEPGPLSLIRKILPYTTAAAVIAVLYVAWVFTSRWVENRRMERESAAQHAAADKPDPAIEAGGALKILNFYASKGVIAHGEEVRLCYGVANAKIVRLDPPVERVWPSIARCFDVSPKRETRYTLTAEDEHGRTESQSIVLQVK
jgi:HAMP domain-containing protein